MTAGSPQTLGLELWEDSVSGAGSPLNLTDRILADIPPPEASAPFLSAPNRAFAPPARVAASRWSTCTVPRSPRSTTIPPRRWLQRSGARDVRARRRHRTPTSPLRTRALARIHAASCPSARRRRADRRLGPRPRLARLGARHRPHLQPRGLALAAPRGRRRSRARLSPAGGARSLRSGPPTSLSRPSATERWRRTGGNSRRRSDAIGRCAGCRVPGGRPAESELLAQREGPRRPSSAGSPIRHATPSASSGRAHARAPACPLRGGRGIGGAPPLIAELAAEMRRRTTSRGTRVRPTFEALAVRLHNPREFARRAARSTPQPAPATSAAGSRRWCCWVGDRPAGRRRSPPILRRSGSTGSRRARRGLSAHGGLEDWPEARGAIRRSKSCAPTGGSRRRPWRRWAIWPAPPRASGSSRGPQALRRRARAAREPARRLTRDRDRIRRPPAGDAVRGRREGRVRGGEDGPEPRLPRSRSPSAAVHPACSRGWPAALRSPGTREQADDQRWRELTAHRGPHLAGRPRER